MIDYVFFPGIAAYLALTSVGSPGASWGRVPLLIGSLAFSLSWTAIEKFLYPGWTTNILMRHPALTAGLAPSLVVVIAGFVEFTLAFYLVTGRGLLRFGAVAYMAIFISAIPEFGHLDWAGHIPIVAILGVACLHGASPPQDALRLGRQGLAVNAGGTTLLYLVTLATFFAMYYGVQWGEYG